jgi:hypothetical protein
MVKIIIETDKIIVKAAIGEFMGEQTSPSAVGSLNDLVANIERLEYKCGVETTYSSSQNTNRLVGHGARRKGKESFLFFHWRNIFLDNGSSKVSKDITWRSRDIGHNTITSLARWGIF